MVTIYRIRIPLNTKNKPLPPVQLTALIHHSTNNQRSAAEATVGILLIWGWGRPGGGGGRGPSEEGGGENGPEPTLYILLQSYNRVYAVHCL